MNLHDAVTGAWYTRVIVTMTIAPKGGDWRDFSCRMILRYSWLVGEVRSGKATIAVALIGNDN